jgi:hypothetical protein
LLRQPGSLQRPLPFRFRSGDPENQGKSYLVDTVRRLIPEKEVAAVTSLSDQALNYAGNLIRKFLILGEAVHTC